MPWEEVDASVDLVVVVVEVVVRLNGGVFDAAFEAAGCETLTNVRPELKLLRGDDVRFSGMMASK